MLLCGRVVVMSVTALPDCIPEAIRENNILLCLLLDAKNSTATRRQLQALLITADAKVIDCLSLCAWNILTGRVLLVNGNRDLQLLRRHRALLVYLAESTNVKERRRRLVRTPISKIREAFSPLLASINAACAIAHKEERQ